MNNKKVFDLSPKILGSVSIVSIILIICNVLMDIIFGSSIKYSAIVPLIALFVFSEHFRKSTLESKK